MNAKLRGLQGEQAVCCPGPHLSEGQQVLLLLLQGPLALLDELVHGWGTLGWRNGRSRCQWRLRQRWQGGRGLQLRRLLLADDWQGDRTREGAQDAGSPAPLQSRRPRPGLPHSPWLYSPWSQVSIVLSAPCHVACTMQQRWGAECSTCAATKQRVASGSSPGTHSS